MKRLIIISAFLILTYTVFGKAKNYSIFCTLTGFEDGTEFSLINLDDESENYTGNLRNGKLVFKGNVKEPSVFRLSPKGKFDPSIYLNFWIENRAFELKAEIKDFYNPTIKGSPLNDIDRAVLNKYGKLNAERDNLMRSFSQADEKKQQEIIKQVREIDKKVLEIRLQTIAEFTPSLVTVKELFFLRNDLPNDKLSSLFKKFPSALKSTKYGKVISQYLLNGDIKIGAKAAEIGATDINNRFIKLSDFKNKVVLLDFWASWCSPCRKSNKELAEIYRKYQPEGFEIISFSTDTNPKNWQSASKDDGIFWSNISDLKGFYSKEAASYKIRSLPRAFLINKSGEIVQIFSGYDNQAKRILEEKIKELLKQ